MLLDIEFLMDIVEEEHNAYAAYSLASKNLYKGSCEGFKERKKRLHQCDENYVRQKDIISAIAGLLQFDNDQIERLCIAARAVKRWRKHTNYEKLLPDSMQMQIAYFLFGTPTNLSCKYRYCGCWEVYLR